MQSFTQTLIVFTQSPVADLADTRVEEFVKIYVRNALTTAEKKIFFSG